MQVPTGGIAHEPQGMIRCDSEADSIVWMKEDKMRKGAVSALACWMTALECVRSGVFCCARVCAPLSRPEPGVRGVFLPTFAGIALMTCKAYLEKRRKTIESKSSGQGASPYRWYSPRAVRQIRCNSEADSDSLDGRRRTAQGEVYPPASSVTALGCHTHSGAFCLRKSFACHFCALNLRFRVFLLEVIA